MITSSALALLLLVTGRIVWSNATQARRHFRTGTLTPESLIFMPRFMGVTDGAFRGILRLVWPVILMTAYYKSELSGKTSADAAATAVAHALFYGLAVPRLFALPLQVLTGIITETIAKTGSFLVLPVAFVGRALALLLMGVAILEFSTFPSLALLLVVAGPLLGEVFRILSDGADLESFRRSANILCENSEEARTLVNQCVVAKQRMTAKIEFLVAILGFVAIRLTLTEATMAAFKAGSMFGQQRTYYYSLIDGVTEFVAGMVLALPEWTKWKLSLAYVGALAGVNVGLCVYWIARRVWMARPSDTPLTEQLSQQVRGFPLYRPLNRPGFSGDRIS